MDHRVKFLKSENRDKYLNLARQLKNLLNIMVTMILIVVWCTWNYTQRTGKNSERLVNMRTSGDYQD